MAFRNNFEKKKHANIISGIVKNVGEKREWMLEKLANGFCKTCSDTNIKFWVNLDYLTGG
jgi:hypothetical protein